MPSFWKRVALAFRSFFLIFLRGEIPTDVLKVLAPASRSGPTTPETATAPTAPLVREAKEPPVEPFDRAVQVLALLQRDGRLIDFLTEDIGPYSDEQIGAAVRDIQGNCRQVLARYLKLEPITASKEDQPYTVAPGFDPASIKLIGNVQGTPPIRGVLRHRGWRVAGFDLPSLPQSAARMIVAPAEVEIV